MIAIGDFNEKWIGNVDRIDLYMYINLNESSILFIGVWGEMHSGYVSEGCFVIWIYFVNFESIFKYLSLHVVEL